MRTSTSVSGGVRAARLLLTAVALLAGCAAAGTSARRDELGTTSDRPAAITLDAIFAESQPWSRAPGTFFWAADGKTLFFCQPGQEDSAVQDLWRFAGDRSEILVEAHKLLDAPVELTEAQRSARERRRVRHRGITDVRMDRVGLGLLIPLDGRIFYYDLHNGRTRQLFDPPGGEIDPRLSPDGSRVAFVRAGDLWLLDLSTGRQQRLTNRPRETVSNGLAEFVAQEELERYRGFWWSPDGGRIAYARVDESPVQKVLRPRYAAAGVEVIEQRYPAAGTANARVRLGVLDLSSARTTWLDTGNHDDFYLARVKWTSRGLAYQLLSRDQKTLELYLWSPKAGNSRLLLREQDEHYINLHHDFRALGRRGFLWSSEREGYRRLWLHDWEGKPLRPLSPPGMVVARLEAAGRRFVLATASTDRGRQQQLFLLPLGGGPARQLTNGAGWHQVIASPTAGAFVDSYSDLLRPPRVELFTVATKRQVCPTPVPCARPRALLASSARAALGTPPRPVTIPATDGTQLNGILFVPPGFDERRRYPAIISTYGGPHGQVAARRWRHGDLWQQYLAGRGFVVLACDGRGTGHRGKSFETALWHNFGVVDVQDVEAAAHYLAGLDYIDAGRLGLWGWSYGGYLTVITLLRTGSLFRAGLAVAPVTDWSLYDTAYTERYLGNPRDQREVYQRACPLPLADRLQGSLMIIHGMSDDNVLLQHTLKLVDALVVAGQHFRLLLYPGKRHSIKGRVHRRHLLEEIGDFFGERLAAPGGKIP